MTAAKSFKNESEGSASNGSCLTINYTAIIRILGIRKSFQVK